MTSVPDEQCSAGHPTDDASAMIVAIAIRPGLHPMEQTLAFSIPVGLDLRELRSANFVLADGVASFTVAWVHEGDPAGGYFDAPFGESAQTLIGALNIAKRRLQGYLQGKGVASCFWYFETS